MAYSSLPRSYSIALRTRLTNNRAVGTGSTQGDAMKKQIQQLSFVVTVLAALLPLPAAAEMPSTATCDSPSWSALVAGECGIGDIHVLRQPRQGEEDGSTALVDEIPGSIPEPETYALMLVGLVAVVAAARKRRRN